MPKSFRHQRMAARAGRQAPLRREYEITDPTHKPDLRGEFAGAKVARRGSKQFVTLSDQQARFYLDQGVLRPVGAAERSEQLRMRAPGIAVRKPVKSAVRARRMPRRRR